MALSPEAKRRLEVGLAQVAAGDEVQAAIDASTTANTNTTGDVVVDFTAHTGTVQPTKLAKNELTAVVGDVGVKDLLVAAAAARIVMIVVTITTVFADGNGAQPTLTIGEESGSATKFAAAAKFTGAAAGSTFAFAGTLTSGKKLQCTQVAGTGTATGAYTIDVQAVG